MASRPEKPPACFVRFETRKGMFTAERACADGKVKILSETLEAVAIAKRNCRPRQKGEEDDVVTTLYMSNVPRAAREADVREAFDKIAPVELIVMMNSKNA